jgi:hypothetical protein
MAQGGGKGSEMSVFTDDDLKRWKEFSKKDINGAYHIDMDGLRAMIARLEAAEIVGAHAASTISEPTKKNMKIREALAIWRKAAGK